MRLSLLAVFPVFPCLLSRSWQQTATAADSDSRQQQTAAAHRQQSTPDSDSDGGSRQQQTAHRTAIATDHRRQVLAAVHLAAVPVLHSRRQPFRSCPGPDSTPADHDISGRSYRDIMTSTAMTSAAMIHHIAVCIHFNTVTDHHRLYIFI